MCLLVSSCSGGGGQKGEESDSILVSQLEIRELNYETQAFVEATSAMRQEMFQILLDLEKISDETIDLERERERQGYVDDKVVNRIKEKVETIRIQIENAQKKAEDNSLLMQQLELLKEMAEKREVNLEYLRKQFRRKKSKLQMEYEELLATNQNLENLVEIRRRDQAKLEREENQWEQLTKTRWSQAGDKLMEVVDLVVVETNKKGEAKNKTARKVVEAKKGMLRLAVDCYQKSMYEGDESASYKKSVAEAKLQAIENGESL